MSGFFAAAIYFLQLAFGFKVLKLRNVLMWKIFLQIDHTSQITMQLPKQFTHSLQLNLCHLCIGKIHCFAFFFSFFSFPDKYFARGSYC